jgi:hypothetical protein
MAAKCTFNIFVVTHVVTKIIIYILQVYPYPSQKDSSMSPSHKQQQTIAITSSSP